MHQLPGRRPTRWRWIKTVFAMALTAVATVWLLALLPFLLLAALILAILMVPVVQRLRRELESTGSELGVRTMNVPKIDVTPWHRQVRNAWNKQTARSAAAGWKSAATQEADPERK